MTMTDTFKMGQFNCIFFRRKLLKDLLFDGNVSVPYLSPFTLYPPKNLRADQLYLEKFKINDHNGPRSTTNVPVRIVDFFKEF